MKKVFSVFVIALFLLSSFSVGYSEENKPINIAFVGPLTGDYAEYGISFRTAVQVALDQINNSGGVLGREVQMIVFDDKNLSDEAAAIAEKIADNDSICAVIGHFSSGVAMTAAQIYQEVGIVLMSASSSHVDYSSIGDYIFRNNVTITIEAANDVQIAYNNGVKRLGILKLKSDWGEGAETATLNAYNQVKDYIEMELVHTEEYEDGVVDFSSYVNKFEDKNCDGIIVLGGYQYLAPFARQYKAFNSDIILISQGSAYTEELINLAGESAEGILFPAGMDPNDTDPKIVAFVKAYSNLNNDKVPDNMAAQTYDNAMMVFESIKKAGSDNREAIKNALYSIDYDGCSGRIFFDEKGDAQKTQSLFVVKDGSFVSIPGALLEWSAFVKKLSAE